MPNLLYFSPVLDRLDLTSPTVAEAFRNWRGTTSLEKMWVAEVDPQFTHSAEFCEHYEINPSHGSNCVIVESIRGDSRTLAACVAPIDCRIDFNKSVKKALGARKVSFAPMQEVLRATGMQYGGIAPLGLPSDWPILLDTRIAESHRIITGSGITRSKLSLPGIALTELSGARIIEGLGVPAGKSGEASDE